MSHTIWVLREDDPLNTCSKDSLLKATLKAPAVPAIFLLFPRTRFPALCNAPFAEELPELPVLPRRIGYLLPEEREPLKTACFAKQMRHKNDRAVLTRRPHPVRHNRSACFITEMFGLELPKISKYLRSQANTCGFKCVYMRVGACICVCVSVFTHVPVGMQKCILQSSSLCPSSARPCHPLRIHQAVVHHMYCAFFCYCIVRMLARTHVCTIFVFLSMLPTGVLGETCKRNTAQQSDYCPRKPQAATTSR